MWYTADKNALMTLLSDLSALSGTTVRFFDMNRDPVFTAGQTERFCACAAAVPALCARCRSGACLHLHGLADQRDEPLVRTCPLGVSEVIVPAVLDGCPVGWVCLSGLVPAQGQQKKWEDIRSLCRTAQRETAALQEAFFALKRYDAVTGGLAAFLRMAEVCMHQMAAQKIVRLHYPSFLEEALKVIEDNIRGPLSVKEVAEALDVSPAYLTDLMSKELGICPSQYIMQKKMRIAADLLQKDGEMSIAEAGTAVGLGDAGYFSRVFKKYHGLSPSEYLAANREQAHLISEDDRRR